MLRQSFQRTLLFAFALLAGLAGAAGPQMGQATRQDVADASRVALAGHSSDSYAPYDYRALSDGGSYYAPGSYGSWFYVTPPASDAVASADPIPAPSYQTPPPALHKYYDYDRFRGPLFG